MMMFIACTDINIIMIAPSRYLHYNSIIILELIIILYGIIVKHLLVAKRIIIL